MDAARVVAAHLVARRGGKQLDEARVAFQLAPGFEYIAVQWGIWWAGGVAVPLPLSHPPVELEYFIRDSEAAFVIADEGNAALFAAIARTTTAEFLTSDRLLHNATDLTPGSAVEEQTTAVPSARAMILYTSGTTSRPKGVVTTHGNITAQIESLVSAWEWAPRRPHATRAAASPRPRHHQRRLIGAVGRRDPRDPSQVRRRGGMGATGVGRAHRVQRRTDALPSTHSILGVRFFGATAVALGRLPIAAADDERVSRAPAIGPRSLEGDLGTRPARALRNDRSRDGAFESSARRAAARCGWFAAAWRLGASSRRRGAAQGSGRLLGVLAASGGYSLGFVDGWFRTGDLAVIEEGAYRLLGRSSVDIIKSGGDKISALEIEEVLRSHPAIRECAVVGIDDLEWGQRVCCAVRTGAGREPRSRRTPHVGAAAPCVAQDPERPALRRRAAEKCAWEGRQAAPVGALCSTCSTCAPRILSRSTSWP